MQIPTNIPGLKPAIILLGIYGVVWISLEGALWRVVLMGSGVAIVSAIHLLQSWFGGQWMSFKKWILTIAIFGLITGLGSGVLTLFFMSVKTGLHAHGPEFPLDEVSWIMRQIPLWSIAGLLTGLGLGLLMRPTSTT